MAILRCDKIALFTASLRVFFIFYAQSKIKTMAENTQKGSANNKMLMNMESTNQVKKYRMIANARRCFS
jgi:hypothetical protein